MASPSMQQANTKLLTPVVKIDTKVPAPDRPFANVDSDPGRISADGNQTIVINACSEFVTETVPLTPFDGAHKLKLVHDVSGSPMLFTMGNDDKLYATIHVEGAPQGWKVFDITPPISASGTVITFDALQTIDNRIVIATACKNKLGIVGLYHSTLVAPQVSWNAITKQVVGFDANLVWRSVTNNLDQKAIASITVCPAPGKIPFQIYVGTAATNQFVATHFVVSPDPQVTYPWREVSLPESSKKVIDMAPANIWEGPGLFTLYERYDDSFACTFDSLDSTFHYRIRTTDIGTPQGIFANSNPWNMTDLVVAGDNGIGFFNFCYPDRVPDIILPGRSFQQVVCSEVVDPTSPTTQTKLSIFAISDEDDLYYVEGIRSYATNKIEFVASGLPIAANVAEISTQYNSAHSATELIYLGNDNSEIIHLWQDPNAKAWMTEQILTQRPSGTTSFPAFVTSLTFSKTDGGSVGGDYPVRITSPLVHSTVNDRSRIISGHEATFLTDTKGRIRIVTRVDETLTGPEYTVTLTKFTSSPRSFAVHSAQRVLRMLGNVESADNLKDATSTDGRKVFDQPDDKLSDAGSLLSHFPTMLNSVAPNTAKAYLDKAPGASKNVTFGYVRDENGKVTNDTDWISNVIDGAEEMIADLWQWLKSKVKAAIKFGIHIVGKAVSFVFMLAGKAIKFLVKAAGPLLTGLVTFLRDYLGIDLSGLLNWLSFIFDRDSALKTQKMLLNFVDNSHRTIAKKLQEERQVVVDEINMAHDSLASIIKDNREPLSKDPNAGLSNMGSPMKSLSFIIDNPIMETVMKFNPLTLILDSVMEGVEEELSAAGIQIPDFMSPILDVLQSFMDKELNNLTRLLTDAKAKMWKAMLDENKLKQSLYDLLGDTIWTLFDMLKDLIISIMDGVVAAMESMFLALTGTWKLGFITDLWEEFAGMPFSAMNCMTLVASYIFNLFTLVVYDKLPEDVFGNPNVIFDEINDATTAMVEVKAAHEKQHESVTLQIAQDIETEEEKKKKRDNAIDTYETAMSWLSLIVQVGASISTWSGFAELIASFPLKPKAPGAPNETELDDMNDSLIGRRVTVNQNQPLRVANPTPLSQRQKIAIYTLHFIGDSFNICGRGIGAIYTTVIYSKYEDYHPAHKKFKATIQWSGFAVSILDLIARIVAIKMDTNLTTGLAELSNAVVCTINLVDAGDAAFLGVAGQQDTTMIDYVYDFATLICALGSGSASISQSIMAFASERDQINMMISYTGNTFDAVFAVVAVITQILNHTIM